MHSLPSQDLRDNINQLESLFRVCVENITKRKLTPLVPEHSNSDLQQPFSSDESSQTIITPIESKPDEAPRVTKAPPRVTTRTKDNDPYSADAYLQGTLRNLPPNH